MIECGGGVLEVFLLCVLLVGVEDTMCHSLVRVMCSTAKRKSATVATSGVRRTSPEKHLFNNARIKKQTLKWYTSLGSEVFLYDDPAFVSIKFL